MLYQAELPPVPMPWYNKDVARARPIHGSWVASADLTGRVRRSPFQRPFIPSSLDVDSSRLPSDAGRAHPRPWLRAHGRAGPPSRPDTGDVSVSGLAGIIGRGYQAKGELSYKAAPSVGPCAALTAAKAGPCCWAKVSSRASKPSHIKAATSRYSPRKAWYNC